MAQEELVNRLVGMYEFTVEDLERLFAIADDDDRGENERDEATREAYDRVYGVGARKVVRLTLAGGGPAAWLDVTIVDREITEMEWVGVWGPGNRIERSVEEDSPLWRLGEYHVQGWEA